LRGLIKKHYRNEPATPEGAVIPSGGFLRRPALGERPWAASGMYQRKAALERPACDLLSIL
jgi:hypothetical protein